VFGFAQQERKRRGGRTYWVFVAGEGPEDGGHGPTASAAGWELAEVGEAS